MMSYTKAAMERAMKVQKVILRAMAKRSTWWQAAEIIGISDRQMRRWRARYEEFGFRGLFDRRRGKPSPKRVAAMAEDLIRRAAVVHRLFFCSSAISTAVFAKPLEYGTKRIST
jgi:hypothetical protein